VDRLSKLYKRIANLKPRGFWPGFIVGLFYFGWIFSWFWSLYPLSIFGVSNRLIGAAIVLFIHLISVLGTAVFWGIFSFSIFRFLKNSPKIYVIPLFFASTFVLIEYLRAWFFGILWFGDGAIIGPHWTLGNIAYFFSDFSFIANTASLWGIYGMNFIILFLATSLILAIRWTMTAARNSSLKSLKKEYLVLAVSFIAMLTLPLINLLTNARGEDVSSEHKIIVSIVQTKNVTKDAYSTNEFLDDLNQKLKLLDNLSDEAKDEGSYIIFPEGSNFSSSLSSFLGLTGMKDYFNNLSENTVLVVDNNRVQTKAGFKSRTTITHSKLGVIGVYDKKLLTMGGEYLPYIVKIPLQLISSPAKRDFINTRQFSRGHDLGAINTGDQQVKILVCSDLISPNISSNDGAGFIIVTNSLGIFGNNKNMENQLLSISKIRALESRKYLVFASNFGHSFIVDPLGNVIKSTDATGYQILTGGIVPNQKYTWYNKLGDWPILLASLVIFGLSLMRYRHDHKNKNFS